MSRLHTGVRTDNRCLNLRRARPKSRTSPLAYRYDFGRVITNIAILCVDTPGIRVDEDG